MSWRPLLAAGFLAAALAGLAGGALEWWRFGESDAAAASRVEAHVRREFEAMMGALTAATARVANEPGTADALASGPDAARQLFDVVARARAASPSSHDVALTVYDSKSVARAWVGRPSEILHERITGGPAFFVAEFPFGLRLVHVQPIAGADEHRLGAVAAEHVLSPALPGAAVTPIDHGLSTPIAPVSLRMRYEGAGDVPRPGAFLLRTPSGDPLVEATVAAEDLRRARARWRRYVVAAVGSVAGLTLLFLAGPLLDRRARAFDARVVLGSTFTAATLIIVGAIAIWLALVWAAGGPAPAAVNLLVGGAAAAGLAALAAGPVSLLRVNQRASRRTPAARPAIFAARQIAAGAVVVLLSVLFARVLQLAVDPLSVDLRHFSLHPLNDGSRVMLLGGILATHVAVVWTATLTLAAASAGWRLPRRLGSGRIALAALWLLPALVAAAIARAVDGSVPAIALIATAIACAAAAANASRLVAWFRHATVAARILGLFVAFVIPALLVYPYMDFFATRATERLIAEQFAVEAQNHPQTLQHRLAQARAQIDALPILPDLVRAGTVPPTDPPPTESAFHVWSQTVLAVARLTSSVELYNREGILISRFALNLPEYTGTAQKLEPLTGCDWDVFGEAAPFGSEERTLLHAERNICVTDPGSDRTDVVGTIFVHVAFDYRTLPFITSQSPYFELFRPAEEGAPREGTTGGEVDVAIYGWGLRPIYASGRSAWPITDDLFARIYASRAPFWATVPRDGRDWRVHFANDRARIFAIGHPMPSAFDHLVHLAELTTLTGVTFVVVLLASALFTRASRGRPRMGRALLREIRASFYRKLFLAFVLASVLPVLTLAFVIRAYFAELLRKDVAAEAVHTAAVAQRVIEGSDALLRRGADGVTLVSDDVMIWISQIIGQDVNIFEGPHLVATSERDLFASGLLPTRTPDEVYRAIALDRVPSFVDEDRIGTLTYMIAAVPVRAAGRDAILTVPQTPRQREIEREKDDLDRGVHLAALFFVLFGAGMGLWLAERIADPVRRLTRATRRIAEGDFDARIAVKSADELKRLVDAFNSMAAELKAQRAQLERTNRLEAWAEMARQVAHEIKNPLTPIQLSAEHLRRVHADRGEPLGPVLDGCISAILGQVKLLRQISAEFSSFASSPTAVRTAVDLPEVVSEVVDPYRTGLEGRIALDNRATGPLPPVLVDRTLIARALSNIVENALHAMPGPGELRIEASSADGVVRLAVQDTGVGMDRDALARAFEPYFSTKTTGTGLGLAIARRNVELSGGSIEVESAKGAGTTVTVSLPVAPDVTADR